MIIALDDLSWCWELNLWAHVQGSSYSTIEFNL